MKLIKTKLLLIISITLLASIGKANLICDGSSDCQNTHHLTSSKTQELPQIGDVIQHEGEILRGISLKEAHEVCHANGGRIPSLKEFALEATTECNSDIAGIKPCGARVLEVTPSSEAPNSFFLVRAKNPDGKIDEFYYSLRNYITVTSGAFGISAWTSSVVPEGEFPPPHNATAFDGKSGLWLYTTEENPYVTLRCIDY